MNRKLAIALILGEIAAVPVGIVGTVHAMKYKNIVCINGIKYRYVENGAKKYYEVYGICNDDKDLITDTFSMPDYIEYLPVARIAANAFKDVDNFKYLIFPSTLEVIYDNAFVNCNYLNRVSIRGSVKIYDSAFNGCSNLTTIDDNAENITIYQGAFDGCNNITSFDVNSTKHVCYFISTTINYSNITLNTDEPKQNWTKVNEALSKHSIYIY